MRSVILILFIFLSEASWADEKSPIDKEEQQCMEKNLTTAGMINCSYQARVKWDAQINKYYALLMKKLNSDQRLHLKEAQRAWIKFRDLEFKNIESIYFSPSRIGSINLNFVAGHKEMIVKERAETLKAHYETLINN